MSSQTCKSIDIVGIGIRGVDNLSLGGLRALQKADLTLSLVPELDEELRSLGVTSIRSISDEYHDGAIDEDNYARLLGTVRDAMTEVGNLALAIPGDPRLGVSLSNRVYRIAEEAGCEIHSHEGISSFAALTHTLRVDPLERGSVIVDANRLLLFEYKLDPALDVYLYHVCSVGVQRTHMSDPSRDNSLKLLGEHLGQFYPMDQPVYLISAGGSSDRWSDQITEAELCRITDLLPVLTFASTLYIPGNLPKRVSREFLELLTIESQP
jgi:uncharacterized protein YabN with tetrapyrrole methylase and pyrophosphatase domain